MLPPVAANARPTSGVLTTAAVSNAWRLGTILDALAVADSANGRVRLQVGARQVEASTSLPLRAGNRLRLQVVETGRQVVLKTVDNARSANPVRSAIRQAIPQQGSQVQLLANLAAASRSERVPPQVQAAVSQLSRIVQPADNLRNAEGLRRAVRDSGLFLEHKLASGRPVRAVQPDWKAALLRFRQQLVNVQQQQPATTQATRSPSAATQGGPPAQQGPSPVLPQPPSVQPQQPSLPGQSARAVTVSTAGSQPIAQTGAANTQQGRTDIPVRTGEVPPPLRHASPAAQPVRAPAALPTDPLSLVGELVRHTEAALSRIRLDQLGSITPEQGGRQVWLLELPVQHPDRRSEIVTLRVERDDNGNSERHNASWAVDLAFDLGPRGELRARVALHAGKVTASFWADQDKTRADVQAGLAALRENLEERDLDIGLLSCGVEKPANEPAAPSSLLETTA